MLFEIYPSEGVMRNYTIPAESLESVAVSLIDQEISVGSRSAGILKVTTYRNKSESKKRRLIYRNFVF